MWTKEWSAHILTLLLSLGAMCYANQPFAYMVVQLLVKLTPLAGASLA